MKRFTKSVLALFLSLVMLIGILPLSSSAADRILNAITPAKTISFASLSDIHYYPVCNTDNYSDDFMKFSQYAIASEPYYTPGLLESGLAAIEAHSKENGQKLVIIPGDLTMNGELEGHQELAKRLEKFENDTGISVVVINGNHDINKKQATTFANGYKEAGNRTSPEQFREIYKNLGYDLAYHTYTPSSGKANCLSYSIKYDGYRIIMMDTGKYSSEVTEKGDNFGETAGCMTEDFIKWVENEIADAKNDGETVLGVCHHNLVAHFTAQYTIIRGFLLDNFEEITDRLADAGMKYVITGHQHIADTAEQISDNGNKISEVTCDSLNSFPNYYNEFTMSTSADGKITLENQNCEIDCVKPVEVRGVKYEQPFRMLSYDITFGGRQGLRFFAENVLTGLMDDFGKEFREKGVTATLKSNGFDLENIIGGFFGNGITVGDFELFTTKNLMNFVDDLFSQLTDAYFTSPDLTVDYLMTIIDKLLEIQVSELPCTKFYDEYGIGDANRPGNFEDLIRSVMIYLYDGGYDMNDDAFMLDAIEQFRNGDTIFVMFDKLLDIAQNDIVDIVLSDLKLNVDELFPDGSFGEGLGKTLQVLIEVLFLGDTSYLNIADSVLNLANKLDIVEYSSLWGILEHVMDEYLTDSQLQSVGCSFADIICNFALDENVVNDRKNMLVNDGAEEVIATQENYRLPTAVTFTFGENQFSRNISWYTKSSVTGSDIEIIGETDSFKGENKVPLGITVEKQTIKTVREYYGVDFGVAGIMSYEFPMNRHIVNIKGLEAGKTYKYRVGDAERNWWSKTGTFTVDEISGETSFVHIGDPQCSSESQYRIFTNLIKKADEMYNPAFIVDTGDNVDHGDNFRQWQWYLNSASDTLMGLPVASASGNHEDKGEYAIEKNFCYSNIPEQDTKTGIYYSFDYNNVHIAILNTNDIDGDNTLGDKQIDWLIDDMQESDADWKFVAFHKAMYSNGSHYDDKDVIGIRDELCKLMPQLGIDVVFQGHDHVYLRTDSMIDNEVESVTTSQTSFDGKEYIVKESPVGTVYAISGCAGVKIYKVKDFEQTDEYFPRAEAIVNADKSVFSGVKIVGDTLYFDAYMYDFDNDSTERIDSFAIHKDLSVKKGTGVDDNFTFKDFLKIMKEIVLPKLVEIFSKIIEFLTSQKF